MPSPHSPVPGSDAPAGEGEGGRPAASAGTGRARRGWRRNPEVALLAPLAFLALLVAANWTVVALAEARLRAAAAEALAALQRGEITGEEAARQVSILLDDRDRRLYAVAVIEGAPPRIEVTGPRSSAGLIGPFGVLAFGDLFVQVDGRPDRSPNGAAAPEADPLGRVTRAEREAAAAAAEAPSPAGPVIPGAEDGR